MEVVGAIASFIAIGQALASTPKIIDALRSLVEVRQELLELLNEVELLNSFGKLIRERIDKLPDNDSLPQPTLLRSVAADLAVVVSELEDLTRECQEGWKKNGQAKVARLKWLRYRRRIASLSKRARKNREYLQLIFSFTSLCASTSNGQMILDIHTIVTTSRTPSQPVDEDIITETSSMGLTTVPNNSQQSTSSIIAEGLAQQLLPSEQESLQPLVQVTAAVRRSCARDCACQCHSPVSQNMSQFAISPVLGWLNTAYNSVLHLGPRRCDILHCRRSRSPVHLNIRFPLLFCSRMLEARLSIGSIAGAGASLHLRIPRQLSGHEELWSEISSGKIEILRMRLTTREFSPIDQNGQSTPLEHAIMYSQYEVMSLFLDESISIFQGTSFGERAAAYARRHILPGGHGGPPNEKTATVLRRVIALDEDTDDYFPIHEAVRGYGDLTIALTTSSERINTLDSLGRTPLHWAVLLDNTEAIHQLVTHGANPDTRDHRGITPLMMAAWQARYDCMRGLIDAGCDVNITDGFGQSALCHALDSPVEGSAQRVGLLLDCGAKLSKVPSGFSGALDYFAARPNAAEVEEKFQLIIRVGGKSAEKDGQAVMRSLEMNNGTLTQLLVDAGYKLNETPGQHNALFTAAWSNDAENMAIFEQAKFTADVRVRDNNGDTPLDVFNSKLDSGPLLCTGTKIYPTDADIEAFRELLKAIRDRYLVAEIEVLEKVLAHLKSRESLKTQGHLKAQGGKLARKTLQSVLQEKLHWNIPAEYKTFRAIDVQIKEEMIEAAIESLQELIEVSRARIGTDPFESDYCQRSSVEDQGLVTLDTI